MQPLVSPDAQSNLIQEECVITVAKMLENDLDLDGVKAHGFVITENI